MDPTHPDFLYKLHKTLYGLKQAPRAWYEQLTEFLSTQVFSHGGTDKTTFIKKEGYDFLITQVYR